MPILWPDFGGNGPSLRVRGILVQHHFCASPPRSIPMRVGSTLQILKDLLQDPVHPCLRRGYGLNWFPHVDSAVHPCAVAAPDHPACAGDTNITLTKAQLASVHPCVHRGYP